MVSRGLFAVWFSALAVWNPVAFTAFEKVPEPTGEFFRQFLPVKKSFYFDWSHRILPYSCISLSASCSFSAAFTRASMLSIYCLTRAGLSLPPD